LELDYMASGQSIDAAKVEAERKAWLSLAGYKFWMFGYHAAQWVLLNRLSANPGPNPFASLVRAAREHRSKRPIQSQD
jgi:hypothetical protein